MDLDHNLLTIEENRQLLERKNGSCDQIIDQLNQLEQHIPAVAKLARSRDFGPHQANGHRMAVYATSKLITYANELTDPKQSCAVLRLINFILDQFERCYQLVTVDRNDNQYQYPVLHWRDHLKLIVQYRKLRKELEVVIYSARFPSRFYVGVSWFLYWLGPQFLYQMYSINSLGSFWSMLTSRQYRKDAFLDALTTTDLNRWANLYIGTEARWFKNTFGFLMITVRVAEVRTEEKFVRLGSRFKIEVNEQLDIDLNVLEDPVDTRSIRMKIYRHKSSDRKKKLVFHCHGGGYLGMSPETHESYLPLFAKALPDCVLVSVGYSLYPGSKFPGPLQEVLDVYLWLTTNPECPLFEEGGPEAVVFQGDSSGAQLLMCLINVLNDMRRMSGNSIKVLMPRTFVPVYASFSLQLSAHASQILGASEFIITPATAFLAVISASSPLIINFKDLEDRLQDNGEPNEDFERLLENLDRLHGHRYMSGLGAKFEELEDVKMSIVSTNYCQYIDQSIAMAHQWRGPIELKIFDRIAHGFISMNLVDSGSKEAHDYIINCIKLGFE